MTHKVSNLELNWRRTEDVWDRESIFADMKEAERAEEAAEKMERRIHQRIAAIMRYVYGACKKDIASTVLKPLEGIVSKHVSELGDPQALMEDYALDESVRDPEVAAALISMEEALHAHGRKNIPGPAGKKASLAELLNQYRELQGKAA